MICKISYYYFNVSGMLLVYAYLPKKRSLWSDLFSYNLTISDISTIYVNKGPGSFAGIRNSMSVVKAFNVAKNIDYYCFSFSDFNNLKDVKYEDVPHLCKKFKIKKNLINPIYLS